MLKKAWNYISLVIILILFILSAGITLIDMLGIGLYRTKGVEALARYHGQHTFDKNKEGTSISPFHVVAYSFFSDGKKYRFIKVANSKQKHQQTELAPFWKKLQPDDQFQVIYLPKHPKSHFIVGLHDPRYAEPNYFILPAIGMGMFSSAVGLMIWNRRRRAFFHLCSSLLIFSYISLGFYLSHHGLEDIVVFCFLMLMCGLHGYSAWKKHFISDEAAKPADAFITHIDDRFELSTLGYVRQYTYQFTPTNGEKVEDMQTVQLLLSRKLSVGDKIAILYDERLPSKHVCIGKDE
ncbi:hypothetical protein GC177_05030 [bacterium]|nr:hypothetical protein [bacterium]